MKPKVFGIGFHKTGTTSLAQALTNLGYRVTGPNWVNHSAIARDVRNMAFELANKFDAFQDNPWPILYKELDEKFPGAKFILTVRATNDWIKSVLNHFADEETPMREWIYGVGRPEGNEAIYIERYERHNLEVMEYFKNREEDLLIFNIAGGDGWEKLCPFLGQGIPAMPFPCVNTKVDREHECKSEQNWLWQKSLNFGRRARKLVARLNSPA